MTHKKIEGTSNTVSSVSLNHCFQLFIDLLQDAALILDAQGVIRAANQAAADLLGKTPAALIQNPYAYFPPDGENSEIRLTDHTGREVCIRHEVTAVVTETGQTSLVILRQVACVDLDGRKLAVPELRQINQDLAQRVQEHTAALEKAHDERRRVEENLDSQHALLRQVIDVIPDYIYVRDRQHRFVLGNKAIANFYNTTTSDIVGKTIQELNVFRPEDIELFHKADQEVMENRVGQFITEQLGKRRDGSPIWKQIHRLPILNAEGEADRVLGVIRDITEVKLNQERIQRQVRQLAALREVDTTITSSFDLRKTLDVLLDQVTRQLGVDAATVLLTDHATMVLNYAASVGFRTNALRSTHLLFGEGNAGRAARERRTIHIQDLRVTPNSLERARKLEDEDFVAYLGVPLIARDQVKGVLEIFHRSPLNLDQEWVSFMEALAGQAAIAIDNATLFREVQMANTNLTLAYDATIEGWARALELRDMETQGHSQRVTDLTLIMAVSMGIKGDDLIHIRRGALLHDIGKMAIPDSILFKPGPLVESEWEVMRRHTIHARDMLSRIDFLQPALIIPYAHHEKWNGTGYPLGLKGEAIPLPASIFSIIDVWDALCHDRPYRKAWKKERVLDYVRENSGSHFDPKVVDTFVKIID